MAILKARKDSGFFIEPLKTGHNVKWEGHHATNPCAIRLSCDPRVFLGYRAGGDDDIFYVWQYKVWGSHLGLAVLDKYGERVTCRLPLPVYRLEHDVRLPQSSEEYFNSFSKGPHAKETLVLHDFRFTEFRGDLYMVYHEGPLDDCFDCVMRMPVARFIEKVNRSIELATQPVEAIIDEWRALWWAKDAWEPCGLDGGNRIFASKVNKGDIIYFELADGTLQMCHRPLAVGTAVLNTGDKFYAEPTPDGLTRYGVYETNIRPGFADNSHLGNNGAPTWARIGDKEVYLDVTHGCWSNTVASKGEKSDIIYYAYLRIKDYQTGELLYYSEDPIIDYGKEWNQYATHGEWISINEALQGVMFVGGQVERIAGRNGLDDEFIAYVGLGDTAIGLARFTPRELLPERVIADIQSRAANQAKLVAGQPTASFNLPQPVNGWRWSLRNDPERRIIEVVRELDKTGEQAAREINSRPGAFDAHGLGFTPDGVLFDEEVQLWAVACQGLRLELRDGKPVTRVGYGLLLLSAFLPEQVLYRSALPVMVAELEGWRFASPGPEAGLVARYRELVPEKVISEIRNLVEMRPAGRPFGNQMEIWQREKSGAAD